MTFYNFDGYKTQKMNDIMRDILKRYTILVKRQVLDYCSSNWICIFFYYILKIGNIKNSNLSQFGTFFFNASNWIRSCHLLTQRRALYHCTSKHLIFSPRFYKLIQSPTFTCLVEGIKSCLASGCLLSLNLFYNPDTDGEPTRNPCSLDK